MRAKDEHIPLSMGLIGQETCGAGGMAYGLRSCVDMIKAVHDIRNYAPNAWIETDRRCLLREFLSEGTGSIYSEPFDRRCKEGQKGIGCVD